MIPRLLNISAFTRQGTLSSFDETSRTAKMVFSTGARVRRFDFFIGEFFEEVELTEKAADLSRVAPGAVPFLKNHGSFFGVEVADVLGNIFEASVDGENGEASVLFSRRPDALPTIQDIKDRVLPSVSMGYLVQAMEKVGEVDGIPIFRDILWQLFEISSIAMPADAGASFRNLMQQASQMSPAELQNHIRSVQAPPLHPCKILGLNDSEYDAMRKRVDEFEKIFGPTAQPPIEAVREKRIPKKIVESSRALPEDQKTGEKFMLVTQGENGKWRIGEGPAIYDSKQAADTEVARLEAEATKQREAAAADQAATLKSATDAAKSEARKEGAKAERERVSAIQKAVDASGLEKSFATELIDDADMTADKAREAVINKLAERDADPKTQTRSVRVEAGDLDEVKTRRESMKEAILHRGMPGNYEITERARNWMGYSLMEMARESLHRQGVHTGRLSKSQLSVRAMHTGSDFPEITADIINKTLRDAFTAAPQTFAPFTRRVQNPDFKQISRVQLGHGTVLEKVTNGGEIKGGTMSEAAEKYFIEEFAKMISITRRTLIDDDLDAFTRIPASMGVKARSLESDLVWAIITDNTALADGFALYSNGAGEHGNLAAAGAAPSITTLGAGRSAMRKQVDLDDEKLNLAVAWLAVPTTLETVGEQLVSQIQPDEAGKVNPFGPAGRSTLQLIVEPRLDDNSLTAWYMNAALGAVDMVELATLSGTTEPEVLTEEPFDTLGMKFRIVHSLGVKAIDFRGLYKDPGA